MPTYLYVIMSHMASEPHPTMYEQYDTWGNPMQPMGTYLGTYMEGGWVG